MRHTNKFKFFLLIILGLIFNHSWSQVTTFSYTGGVQTYTVPLGVTSIQLETWGAQGGTGTGFDGVAGTGGLGGYSIGNLVVTPGQVLEVYVGGAGASTGPGGFNGGGQAGSNYGAAGGGASDVRTAPYALGDRVIVGGGGGGGAFGSYGNPGGHGGGLTGGSGTSGGSFTAGTGGTQVAGGAAGYSYGGTAPGTLGNGGGTGAYHNAGGGGGWYGGGSGAAHAGAGGGSSYIDGVTDGVTTTGLRTGNGEVIITELCELLTVTVTDDEVCLGESFTLNATGLGTVTWDGGIVNGAPFTTVSAGIVTYTATSDDDGDCNFQIDIEVHELPTVTASVDDNEVCDGESFTFTGGGADTYTWDLGVTNGVAFTGSVGTETYTVTGTDANGCQNTATVDATVHELPTVTASVDDDEVCDGVSFTFTGGGADTYSWDSGVTDGVAFTASVGTDTYTVTGTDANGCQNTATIDATVHDQPSVTASVDDDEVCDGESFVFTGGGAATYAWDLGVTDGLAFTASVGTATYTVTGTDANGCQNTATVDATVYELPTVTATVDDSEVCDGASFVFTGGGAATYAWDLGVTDGLAFTASVGTDTYTVTGTDANGCQNTATVDATVYALPAVTASVDASEVCEGHSFIFTGGGATSYAWDMGVTDGVSFEALVGTETYTVTGTDDNGCVNTESVDATVHGLPTIIANASEVEICFDETVIFTGDGAVTYEWDMGVTDAVPFDPPLAGTETYSVIGTDANGCENTASVDVTVNDEIVITYVSYDEVYGGDGEIDITVSGGAPTYTFDWDNDGTGDFDDTEDLTDLVSGTYTVEVKDAANCTAIAVIDVVLSCTPLTVTVSDYFICQNELLILDATSLSGADISWDLGAIDGVGFYPDTTGEVTFTATSEDGSDCPLTVGVEILEAPIVAPTIGGESYCEGDTIVLGAGGNADTYSWDLLDLTPEVGVTTYTLTGVFDETGCATSTSIDVTVHELPEVTASTDHDEICLGNTVILTGDGAETYGWDPAEIINGVEYMPEEIGTYVYTVIGMDENGCENEASVAVNVIEGLTLTYAVTHVTGGGDGEIDLTIEGGTPAYSIDWDNDGTGDFDDEEDLTGLSNGLYTVEVLGSEGCKGNAEVWVYNTAGTPEISQDILSVYPNPATDNVIIEYEGIFNYSLMTINGDIITTGVGNDKKNLNLDDLSDGVYFITIESEDRVKTVKIVKQ